MKLLIVFDLDGTLIDSVYCAGDAGSPDKASTLGG